MSNRSWNKDVFISAVKNNNTKAEVLREIGLAAKGGNYATFDKYVEKWNLDTSHFLGIRKPNNNQALPDSKIFVKDSSASHSAVVRRAKEVLNYTCEICGNTGNWQGKELVLQLDHINGDNSDNRKENLRFLCPNCHSQTDTFGSKNTDRKKKNKCLDCDSEISKSAKRCKTCSNQKIHGGNTKIDWPDTKWLKTMVEKYSYLAVARRLGVSDNAVRKRIKNNAP